MQIVDATAEELSQVAQAQRDARQRRNDLILERRRQGATLRAIGSESGLNHKSVEAIIRKALGDNHPT